MTTMKAKQTVLEIISGDLTTQHVDVVVNPCAANGGGGECSAAIKKKCPELLKGIKMGSSRYCLKAVPDKKLGASFVLHVNCSQNKDLIQKVLDNSLSALRDNNCTSIAFPIIGAGREGRDYDTCARELTDVLCRYFVRRERGDVSFVTEVRVVVFEPERKYDRVCRARNASLCILDQPTSFPGRVTDWRSPGRDTPIVQSVLQDYPKDLKDMVTSVQVRRASTDTDVESMPLVGTEPDVGMTEATVVMHRRDRDGNLVSRVGLRRQ